MKKKRWLIALILVALLLLGAGGGAAFYMSGQIYRDLNAALENEAKDLALTVKVGENEEALTGKYTLKRTGKNEEVSYSYETLTEFALVDGVYQIPSERKTVSEGKCIVANGKLVLLEGQMVNLPLDTLTLSRMHFSRGCFADAVWEEGDFRANVKDPAAFFGFEGACTDMQLSLTYSEGHLDTLTLTYHNEADRLVSMQYTFSYS